MNNYERFLMQGQHFEVILRYKIPPKVKMCGRIEIEELLRFSRRFLRQTVTFENTKNLLQCAKNAKLV